MNVTVRLVSFFFRASQSFCSENVTYFVQWKELSNCYGILVLHTNPTSSGLAIHNTVNGTFIKQRLLTPSVTDSKYVQESLC